MHHELGHAVEARAAYDAALLIHRETGSLQQEAITRCNLGVLDKEQGNQQEAAAHYRASLKIHRETGDRRGRGRAGQSANCTRPSANSHWPRRTTTTPCGSIARLAIAGSRVG